MEDWGRKANWNRDVLERIVALLFALACLADLAAGLPFLRRQQLLGILSHGEAEAWAFVMGLPPVVAVSVDVPEQPGEAARLAASFRALALMLCAMLARTALLTLPGAPGLRADRRKPARRVGRPATVVAPDTS